MNIIDLLTIASALQAVAIFVLWRRVNVLASIADRQALLTLAHLQETKRLHGGFTMPEHITIDGKSYEVVHRFNERRVLIDNEGLYSFADLNATIEPAQWEHSGEPARDGAEKEVLGALVKKLEEKGTQVKVTPPDGE